MRLLTDEGRCIGVDSYLDPAGFMSDDFPDRVVLPALQTMRWEYEMLMERVFSRTFPRRIFIVDPGGTILIEGGL